MADDSSTEIKRRAGIGGVLGALALPARALFGVALLTLLVWWYFDVSGGPLTSAETAVVALFLAVITAVCRAAWRSLRRRLSPPVKHSEARE